MSVRDLETYEVIKEEDLTGIQSKGTLLRHKKSGARVLLIENEDTERMEQIEKCGWFSANELENFIRCAQEKAKLRSLVWLLHLKDKKYGYPKKDFSL